MLRGPFDESVCVIGDRSGRRILHMLENRVEHRPCVLGQFGHELTEFAVEVAKKQQSLLAQHREARVVNRADGILRLEQPRHQWWKLLRQRLCVRRRLQGKAESKVVLAHRVCPSLVCGFLAIASAAAFCSSAVICDGPELEGQLVDCPGEAERQLVAVVHRRAGIDSQCRRSRRWT